MTSTGLLARFRRWTGEHSFLAISIAVHLLFVFAAGVWVVSRYSAGRKLTFNAGPKSPNPSERALQHKVQMQQKTQNTMVAVPKRVLTTGLSKVALPEMPALPGPKMAVQPMMAAGGGGGFGGAQGGMGAAGGTGSGAPINFFGIRDTSTSIVIMIDVSDSMFGRTGDYDYAARKLLRVGKEQSFQSVRDQAIELVRSLTPASRFGIVRWSGGAYSWKPELVPATDENKQAAIDHIQTSLDIHKAPPNSGRPGGTRHDFALEEAFKLKPETIYMLTDGNATKSEGGNLQPIDEKDIWKVAEEGQKALTKKAKLHTIYYLTGRDKQDEERMLRGLASRNGGTFRKVKPPDVKTPPPTATTGASPSPGSSPPEHRPPDRNDRRDNRKKKRR